MQQHLKKALLACMILLFSVSVSSQYRKKRRQFLEGLKIQPKVGINMFYGDLVSKARTNYMFGIAGEKELMPYLNARVDINAGSMKGTQTLPNSGRTYAYFENSFIQFNIGATFRPLDLAYGLFKQRYFNPYVIGELGMIQYNTDEFFGDAGEVPNTLWREVSGISPGVSFGGGLNFYINSHISVTTEFVGTKVFSDKLDGHDVWYSGFGTDAAKKNKTDAGDFFYAATIGVTYLFDDSQWRNSPKYNRKTYLRTRSLYKSKRKKFKRPSRRKTKRYKR